MHFFQFCQGERPAFGFHVLHLAGYHAGSMSCSRLVVICGDLYNTNMRSFKVVLDTNVLVAALRSRQGSSFRLLSLLGRGHFETVISVPLFFEYEDVLAREEIGIAPSSVKDVLDYFCQVSHKQDIHFLWRPFLKDPKDDFVLELAVASRCDAIVTYNIRDFRGSEKLGVRVLRPAEFLRVMGVES